MRLRKEERHSSKNANQTSRNIRNYHNFLKKLKELKKLKKLSQMQSGTQLSEEVKLMQHVDYHNKDSWEDKYAEI